MPWTFLHQRYRAHADRLSIIAFITTAQLLRSDYLISNAAHYRLVMTYWAIYDHISWPVSPPPRGLPLVCPEIKWSVEFSWYSWIIWTEAGITVWRLRYTDYLLPPILAPMLWYPHTPYCNTQVPTSGDDRPRCGRLLVRSVIATGRLRQATSGFTHAGKSCWLTDSLVR